MSKEKPVLVIEDDIGLALLISDKIKEIYSYVELFHNAEDALNWLKNNSAKLLLLDYSLPDMNASEFLEKIKNFTDEFPNFVIATGYGDEKIAVEMMKKGALDYFIKDSGFLNSIPKTLERIFKNIDLQNQLDISKKMLKEKQEHLEKAQKIAHLGSWFYDISNNSFYMTDEMYNILGISQDSSISYQEFINMIHSDDKSRVEETHKSAIKNNIQINSEYRIIRPDKEMRYVNEKGEINTDDNDKVIQLTATLLDITEFTLLKQQLIHSEKLSVIGQLSAGIAHEFNNILSIMRANIQYFEHIDSDNNHSSIEKKNETKELCSTMLKQIERAASIVKQLMIFAKPIAAGQQIFSIKELIDEIIKLQIKQMELENISVIRNYSDNDIVVGDKGQLQQVFLNMFINARHAILPKQKGTITVNIKNDGKNVITIISDTGIGIDEETKSKIFMPFFSTKGAYAKDKFKINGTGLGLSVSQKIIANHNGDINFQSKVNEGTDFIITLPAYTEKQNSNTHHSGSKKIFPAIINESKTGKNILFVDDEIEILTLTKKLLDKLGFKNIKTLNDSTKIIETLNQHNFDIIFIDIMMPGLDGYDAVNQIRKIDKNIRIYFMSGKLEFDQSHFNSLDISGLVQKPIDIFKLIELI